MEEKTNKETRKTLPFVSIVIPVYNEEKYIGSCLQSICDNDNPKEKIEILVYDGGSVDRTKDIIKRYSDQYSFIIIRENPEQYQVIALNRAIKESKGDIIIRCDAHSIYPSNYISTLVKYLLDNNAEVVGASWDTVAGADTLVARAIATALKNPFGVGISYRTPLVKTPHYVDTVPFGAYKREIFNKYGFFDEQLKIGEDFEFHVRIRKGGGKILLIPTLKVKYFSRISIGKLIKMAYNYGYAKPRILKKHKKIGNFRQFFPPLFVFGIPFIFFFMFFRYLYLAYFCVSFCISIFESIKSRDIRYFLILPFLFFSMHFFYGVGYLRGLRPEISKRKNKHNSFTKHNR